MYNTYCDNIPQNTSYYEVCTQLQEVHTVYHKHIIYHVNVTKIISKDMVGRCAQEAGAALCFPPGAMVSWGELSAECPSTSCSVFALTTNQSRRDPYKESVSHLVQGLNIHWGLGAVPEVVLFNVTCANWSLTQREPVIVPAGAFNVLFLLYLKNCIPVSFYLLCLFGFLLF